MNPYLIRQLAARPPPGRPPELGGATKPVRPASHPRRRVRGGMACPICPVRLAVARTSVSATGWRMHAEFSGCYTSGGQATCGGSLQNHHLYLSFRFDPRRCVSCAELAHTRSKLSE
jgi:hypothetical protein